MEDFDITSPIESSEGDAPSPEAVREKSEKQKESYKKAQAQIQRAQKDEKKAKGDNDELFQILTRFIKNPYYETLVPYITNLLTIALPSRPIIALLALIYPDATHHVIHMIGKPTRIIAMQGLHHYDTLSVFHEGDLHISIREWISIWIDSIDHYIVLDSSSLVMQKRFLSMIDSHESHILGAIGGFVMFFFQSRNIDIPSEKVVSYARFILKNIRTTLQGSIFSHLDSDMVVDEKIIDMTLFGL